VKAMADRLLIYGAGDLGSSVRRIAQAADVDVIGYVDDYYGQPTFEGLPVLGTGKDLPRLVSAYRRSKVILAIGYVDFAVRATRFESLQRAGVPLGRCIHPSAIIDQSVALGDGIIVFAGAVVDHGVIIEDNVVLNTGAVVGHDSRIGPHTFVSPGAALAGFVIVERCAMVGLGSRVIERRRVGEGAKVAAGAVVIDDVPAFALVAGVPAVVKKIYAASSRR